MRRNNFESPRDDHVDMNDVLNEIEVRAQAAASATVNDMIARENEMMMQSGGMGQGGVAPMMGAGGVPPTLSQEYLQFVDGTDEIPEWIRKKYWGLLTRMNQLTQIKDERELSRMEASIRAIVRPFVWRTKVSSEEMFMVQHYAKTQVLKAVGGKERRLIAPQLSEITRKEEYHDMSVLSRNQNPGMVSRGVDAVFGR
jgi:hypothetical protein